mmetsp:Transcript_48328/g.142617  ORF Transcript_48328/g.142617 Transcript_48328/m.142617 type:complete len:241 (+) Transcript_48328:1669-2391(+)
MLSAIFSFGVPKGRSLAGSWSPCWKPFWNSAQSPPSSFSSAFWRSKQPFPTQPAPTFCSACITGSTAPVIWEVTAFALARSPALPYSVEATASIEKRRARSCALMAMGALPSCLAMPAPSSHRPSPLHSIARTTCSFAPVAATIAAREASSTTALPPGHASASASPASLASPPAQRIRVFLAGGAKPVAAFGSSFFATGQPGFSAETSLMACWSASQRPPSFHLRKSASMSWLSSPTPRL